MYLSCLTPKTKTQTTGRLPANAALTWTQLVLFAQKTRSTADRVLARPLSPSPPPQPRTTIITPEQGSANSFESLWAKHGIAFLMDRKKKNKDRHIMWPAEPDIFTLCLPTRAGNRDSLSLIAVEDTQLLCPRFKKKKKSNTNQTRLCRENSKQLDHGLYACVHS